MDSMPDVHFPTWFQNGQTWSSSRRRAQPFLLNHCCSKDNHAWLPGPLCNSNRKGITHSVQTARWARTRCSISPNLAPNSNTSEPSPSTSWAYPWEWSRPLVPDTVPFEVEKCHWTQEGWVEPYGIHEKTVLFPWGKVSVAFLLHTISFDKDRLM